MLSASSRITRGMVRKQREIQEEISPKLAEQIDRDLIFQTLPRRPGTKISMLTKEAEIEQQSDVEQQSFDGQQTLEELLVFEENRGEETQVTPIDINIFTLNSKLQKKKKRISKIKRTINELEVLDRTIKAENERVE
jgi:hypothetical protein